MYFLSFYFFFRVRLFMFLLFLYTHLSYLLYSFFFGGIFIERNGYKLISVACVSVVHSNKKKIVKEMKNKKRKIAKDYDRKDPSIDWIILFMLGIVFDIKKNLRIKKNPEKIYSTVKKKFFVNCDNMKPPTHTCG